MAATAEKTEPKGTGNAALADILMAHEALPVAEVLKKVSETDMARAWARGDIEFGRVAHCVTGRPGVQDTSVPEANRASVLLIENTGLPAKSDEWTGRKTTSHQRFSELWRNSQAIPKADKYKKYIQEDVEGELRWKIVDIKREEAEKLMVLYVRLTDQGMGEIE